MTNFYFNVLLVDYYKTLDMYFLFLAEFEYTLYFLRYVDLKYRMMSLLGSFHT